MGRLEVYRKCRMVTKFNNVVAHLQKRRERGGGSEFNVFVLFKYLYHYTVHFPPAVRPFLLFNSSSVFPGDELQRRPRREGPEWLKESCY